MRREKGGSRLVVEKQAGDFFEQAVSRPVTAKRLTITLRANKCYNTFYAAEEGEPPEFLCRASTAFLSCEMPDRCFTGIVFGVYAHCTGDTGTAVQIFSMQQRRMRTDEEEKDVFTKSKHED